MNETQKKKNPSYGSHPPANALSREQLQQRMQAALQNGQGTTRKRPPRPYTEAEAESGSEQTETRKPSRRRTFPAEHLNHDAVDMDADMGSDGYDMNETENRPQPVKRMPRPKPEPAEAVAKAPATAYNPLFIYGGVGLGKTHLMHAIGNRIIQNNPNTKILYVTSEQFINELINSIKDVNYKNELFRNKYRNIDVLLIDDIQFIAGKKMGQEEFFHTFNSLHQNGKQIIISSDKPPRDIPLLEERLKSRFEWGILADISMPDYETRLAILRKKVQIDKIIIDDYILSVIATKIDSNIRELEGALNKIVAYASLTHSPITIEIAEKSINDIVLQKEKVISADYIQEVVAKYFNIDKKDIISSKKSNDIAYPRQIAMYLCRTVAGLSFPKIGSEFGNRDHTTVMHAVNKIEKELKEKTNTKLIVESVKNIIQESN